MDVIDYLEMKKDLIDSLIRKYLPEHLNQASVEGIVGKARYKHDPDALSKALSEPVWNFLNRGGKRWRPALFLLLAEALGGDAEKLRDFAIIPELIHNGTIIIDDIEDLGEMRRGKPCLHKLFGEDIAINAGNFLYFLPLISVIRKCGDFDDSVLVKVYNVYIEEMINVSVGQATDIHWHKGKKEIISEQEYLQMCSFKTGCLARMAGRLASVLSGASEDVEKAVGRFCESLGVAFQIQDDILSASGGEFAKRKGYGDDITEGKRSLLVIYTLSKASEEDRKRLLEIMGMHTKDARLIREALALLNKYGSIEYAKGIARNLVEKDWKCLEPLLKDSEAKQTLGEFARFAIEREI